MKTNCIITCGIACMFFSSMLYMSLNPYKYKLLKDFLSKLDEKQVHIFNEIHNERLQIYIIGLLLGILCGFIYLNFNSNISVYRTCNFISIVMGINYLFYLIYPKSTYMLQHLKNQDQIEAWLTLYKSMQYNQYTGMVLGLIAYILITI